MLQEAHCPENTTDKWTSEWGYKTLLGAALATKHESVFF